MKTGGNEVRHGRFSHCHVDPADAGRQTETVFHVGQYDFMSTALSSL